MNYFVIPGNPPAVHFYEVWKSEWLAFTTRDSFFVSPYARFDLRQDSSEYMKKIIAFHGDALKTYRRSVHGPLTLLGHSLGGFVALELLKEHESEIDHCILLQPFLRAPLPRGILLLKLVNLLHRSKLLEKSLFKIRIHLEQLIPNLKHLSDEEMRLMLDLSFHEYNILAHNRSALRIDFHLASKLHFFSCDADTWCPPSTVALLKAQISHKELKLSHDFVTSQAERRLMTEAIVEHLSEQRSFEAQSAMPHQNA